LASKLQLTEPNSGLPHIVFQVRKKRNSVFTSRGVANEKN
jgi:hypothetical protein